MNTFPIFQRKSVPKNLKFSFGKYIYKAEEWITKQVPLHLLERAWNIQWPYRHYEGKRKCQLFIVKIHTFNIIFPLTSKKNKIK